MSQPPKWLGEPLEGRPDPDPAKDQDARARHRVQLRSDSEFHEQLIGKAREGDKDSAWQLIFLLTDLHDHLHGPLHAWAADFFHRLLEIRDQHSDRPSRDQLSDAFKCLGLLSKRGRSRQLDTRQIAGRLAAEEQARETSASVADARLHLQETEGLGAARLRNLRTEHPDIARIVSEQMTPSERAALAEESKKGPHQK